MYLLFVCVSHTEIIHIYIKRVEFHKMCCDVFLFIFFNINTSVLQKIKQNVNISSKRVIFPTNIERTGFTLRPLRAFVHFCVHTFKVSIANQYQLNHKRKIRKIHHVVIAQLHLSRETPQTVAVVKTLLKKFKISRPCISFHVDNASFLKNSIFT